MGYKIGVDKQQLSLLPACLDDYVPEDHICRVINAFTGQLDIAALGYKHAECKSTGCRPYDPRMMLNLYIYGYLHRVRSSRRLRDETIRNIEVMWLTEGLKPDDKTICNFRTDNATALAETFRIFSRLCRTLGLLGGELVATDSTKFRANNSLKNNYNEIVVKNELSRTDKKIQEYMQALAEADAAEENMPEPSASDIKAALERLNQRKVKFEELYTRVQEAGEISTVDPDARMMRSGGDARELDVCYNVHTVVDSQHHLIVDFDVSNCSSDAVQLKNMSDKAKDIMEVQNLTNLADKGYYASGEIVACEKNGITCLVAKPSPGGPKKPAGFQRQDFIYDSTKDAYICPAQQELRFKYERKHISGREYRVYSNAPACGKCQQKSTCTTYRHREVQRLSCQDVLDRVDERTHKHKELYRKRQEIVEHPFGTIKAVWGYKQFLCRTQANVSAETALTCIAYNLRRICNIFAGNEVSSAMALR